MKQLKKDMGSCSVCSQGTHSLVNESFADDSWKDLSIYSAAQMKKKMPLKWSLGNKGKVF